MKFLFRIVFDIYYNKSFFFLLTYVSYNTIILFRLSQCFYFYLFVYRTKKKFFFYFSGSLKSERFSENRAAAPVKRLWTSDCSPRCIKIYFSCKKPAKARYEYLKYTFFLLSTKLKL